MLIQEGEEKEIQTKMMGVKQPKYSSLTLNGFGDYVLIDWFQFHTY